MLPVWALNIFFIKFNKHWASDISAGEFKLWYFEIFLYPKFDMHGNFGKIIFGQNIAAAMKYCKRILIKCVC